MLKVSEPTLDHSLTLRNWPDVPYSKVMNGENVSLYMSFGHKSYFLKVITKSLEPLGQVIYLSLIAFCVFASARYLQLLSLKVKLPSLKKVLAMLFAYCYT